MEWTENDFEDSMTWTMRQQELENPEILQVYEKFSKEYQEVQKLVQTLMLSAEPQEEGKIIHQILEYREKASLPILHFLLSVKKASSPSAGQESNEDQPLTDPVEDL